MRISLPWFFFCALIEESPVLTDYELKAPVFYILITKVRSLCWTSKKGKEQRCFHRAEQTLAADWWKRLGQDAMTCFGRALDESLYLFTLLSIEFDANEVWKYLDDSQESQRIGCNSVTLHMRSYDSLSLTFFHLKSNPRLWGVTWYPKITNVAQLLWKYAFLCSIKGYVSVFEIPPRTNSALSQISVIHVIMLS